MPKNTIVPAVDSSEFNCPRRGVIGPQAGINTYADRINNHEKLFWPSDAGAVRMGNNLILS